MPQPTAYVFPTPARAVVTQRHKPRDALDLDLYAGERVSVTELKSAWWALGTKRNGDEGWIPLKHIRFLDPDPFDAAPRELYSAWDAARSAALALRQQEPPVRVDAGTFPYPPAEAAACPDAHFCAARKKESVVGLCWHDMRRLLGGGTGTVRLEAGAEVPVPLTAKWVAKEKQKWHPDRWKRIVVDEFRDEADEVLTEVFSLMGQVEEVLRKEEEEAEKRK